MKDLVSREEVKNIIRKYLGYADEKPYDTVDAIIEDLYDLKSYEGIDWHQYPKEKPDSLKNYLLTMYYPLTDKYDIRVGWLGEWGWHIEDELYSDEVIAWAELPKHYEKGEEE